MDFEAASDNDNELASRVKDLRCEDSFNQLFEKYKGLVHWSCYKRLFNHEDAEDATQEVFASFWHEASEKWQGGSIKAYLCGMAKYAAGYMRRHNTAKKRQGGNSIIYLDAEDADGNALELADPRAEYQGIVEKEIEIEIDRVLMLMMPKLRLAWILSRREGYDVRKIAKIMGKSKSASALWVQQAEDYIRETLRAFFDDLNNDMERIEKRAAFRALFD